MDRAPLRLRLPAALALAAALAAAAPAHRAEARVASIVVEADGGRILSSLNADTRNYPASLTKMMTLLLAFEAIESGEMAPDERLPVSARAAGMQPSRLGLPRGGAIRAEDAMLALVTKSANDAAVVLAERLGGSEIEFARAMTRRARELGMKRTTFRNASGLPNKGQLSTARDMAILSRALLRLHPERYGVFATRRWSYNGSAYKNHNRLLDSLPGTDGIKTGYIRASGFNVAASTKRGGVRLITVVFGGATAAKRDARARRLTEEAFERLAREREARALAGGAPGVGSAEALSRALAAVRAARAAAEPEQGSAPGPDAAAASGSALAAAGAPPSAGALLAALSARDERARAGGDWGVQIGAFSGEGRAEAALAVALGRAPSLLAGATPRLEAVEGSARPLVRARFMNLDKRGAYESCRRLRADGIDCLVLAAP